MFQPRFGSQMLRDLWQVVARDATLGVGAKDRYQKFLQRVDAHLPTIDQKSGAEIANADLNLQLDRLHALVSPLSWDREPPAREDVAGTLDLLERLLTMSRTQRLAERALLQHKGRDDEQASVHQLVMRLLEELPDVEAEHEGGAGENAEGDGAERGDDPAGAGAPAGRARGAGKPGARTADKVTTRT